LPPPAAPAALETELSIATAETPARDSKAGEQQPLPGAGSPWPARVLVGAILGLIVVAGLWIRLRNNGYGLPYVYNYDEANHFTNRAVTMFKDDLDPGYYQNPSALTYLLFVTMRVAYGLLSPIFELAEGTVIRQFLYDPTEIWELARAVVAVLAMAGVVGVFWVGRRLWDVRVGLVAAAVLAFAFLPVQYSRIAVTDVGTFLPVALAIYGAVRVWEDGQRRHYVIAGVATGVAIGFKYTAGLVVLPLVIAGAIRIWRDRGAPWLRRVELRSLAIGLALMVVAFAITTPFFFVKPVSALYQLKQQAEAAGEIEKVGQEQQGGFSFYLESLTWGLGWAAAFAALAGAALEVRRDRLRGLLLLIFPIVMFLYFAVQTRYFGRWLLPIYPVLALLCGVALVRLVSLIRGRPAVQAVALAALVAGVLVQPVAADWRTSEVLGEADTRQLARNFIVNEFPTSLRIVIEPGVPDDYYRIFQGRSRLRQFVRGFVKDLRRQAALDRPDQGTTYAATLNPDLIDAYRSRGFCLVVTMSVIRGRAENAQVPDALAYYQRLERESRLIYSVSPYERGRGPVPLHFDFSYNYYPTAYKRPGPAVRVYQLENCRQQFGRVPVKPVGNSGLEKGIGSSTVE
jgi:4-amino-4-deoxy-L-arabinose transferase-like glycosyltransferase